MRLICVLSIAFALGATPAFADDPPKYEPKIVPKCTLAAGVCGYTLGEWKLVLKAEEVPQIQLGKTGKLGWTTWLRSEAFGRDADDLVLRPFSG